MKFIKFIFLLFAANIFAQKGFQINDAKKTVIPFQLVSNLILIPLQINGVELTFLLDSGVDQTLLFSVTNKVIDLNKVEKVTFSGVGESEGIQGLISENNIVTIGKDYKDYDHKIYIILDEDTNFSSHIGIPINGIIGYQFFKDYPVEINFITKKITVFNTEKEAKRRTRKYTEFPITVEDNKPYMMSGVELRDVNTPSKMLIDIGNNDAVWLFPKLITNFKYKQPNIDDYLGRGFNGDIFGKRSRIHRLYLGDFVFEKPLTAMPDEYSLQNLKWVPDRKGSIGNDVFRRFNVILDYKNNQLFLKKNRNFNEPFLFNSSGLDVMHDGMAWEKDFVQIETKKSDISNKQEVYNTNETFQYKFSLKPIFVVAGCRKESPCYTAGIRKNDKIITVNNKKVSDMNLQKLNSYFKDEDGTKVKMQIERNEVTINAEIILKDPIPYQDEN